jgi:phosphatidylethanolamine/phosphatidyl-N-methylethanolamine N-methyltransferase
MPSRSTGATHVVVTNAFVDDVYARLAAVYDLLFGDVLQPGRVAAVARMPLGQPAEILEVGVGTGLSAPLYPAECHVTGIDLSAEMLAQAHQRISARQLERIRLIQMDAARLTFPDDTFDVVYAPYTISVVPEPVRVALEMRRVCKPGGTILFLNHFLSANRWLARVERALSPLTMHLGFRCDVDLAHLLAGAGLEPASIDPINVPPIWRLVTCIKKPAPAAASC